MQNQVLFPLHEDLTPDSNLASGFAARTVKLIAGINEI